jgi:predicted  nucleic acid-binding Zn-ribbon protein
MSIEHTPTNTNEKAIEPVLSNKVEAQKLLLEIEELRSRITSLEAQTASATMELDNALASKDRSKVGALQKIIALNNTERGKLNLELIKKEGELRENTEALDRKYAVKENDIWAGRDTERRSN